MDRSRDLAGAWRARGRRSDHRMARARGVTPVDVGGDRRPRAARAVLRGEPARGLPVARVRRHPPDPPLMLHDPAIAAARAVTPVHRIDPAASDLRTWPPHGSDSGTRTV